MLYASLNVPTVCSQRGVPILTTGYLKSCENGNPGMPIFTGCVYFHDTGVKKRSRGQGLFLVSVKRSRTIFKLGNAAKMVAFLWPLTSGTVNSTVCAVKRSRPRLRCGQAVKQQKRWSKYFDPGRSCDYSAYGSDHPLHKLAIWP